MVLTRPLLLTALALLCAGCLQKKPVVRLAQPEKIAVGFVLDHENDPGADDVPPALKKKIAAVLADRNLEVVEVPFKDARFDSVKGSPRRFNVVGKGARYALLVETKSSFYSQLNGQFRWVVSVRLTAGDHDQADAQQLSRAFDESALLVYDFEKEPEAVSRVSHVIAERAGTLLDEVLAVPPQASADRGSLQRRRSAAVAGDAIYFVMVDRFANGDRSNDGDANPADPAAFHGGDLQGVIDHLDELEALGVGTVWLSPVFAMRTQKFFEWGAYHGYWVEDFTKLEPRFGDEATLKRLSDELHRRGMKLVLDVVLNHVAMDAPLTKAHPDWFHHHGGIEHWDDEQEVVDHDVHGLPDLAQERDDVYAFLSGTSKKWIAAVKPDGFRLDAVKHVPLSFWSRYDDEMRRAGGEDFVLLGEMLDGDPAKVSATQRQGKFSAMFDFPLHFAMVDVFCRGRSPVRLAATLSSDRFYDAPESLVTLLDNHDLPRIATSCGGDAEKVKRALKFLVTARGTPSLTWGTESLAEGEHEPQNRADMDFGKQPLRDEISRLMKLRAEHPALREGAPLVLAADDTLFAYARITEGEAALIAVNTGAESREVALPSELCTAPTCGLHALPGVSVEFVQAAASRGFRSSADRAAAAWHGKGPKRTVHIAVSGASLKPGEKLYLVGSGPELGGWEPTVGLGPLDSGGQGTFQLPAGAVFEFKLVARGPDGVRWQDGENHTLFVESGDGAQDVALSWK